MFIFVVFCLSIMVSDFVFLWGLWMCVSLSGYVFFMFFVCFLFLCLLYFILVCLFVLTCFFSKERERRYGVR